MHNTNGKVRTLSAKDARELNGNIILLRGAKTADLGGGGGGHILLSSASAKNLVAATGGDGKIGQIIFQQQDDLGEGGGVFLQSVKRFGGGTPILLLSGGDTSNGHILIQTTATTSSGGAGIVTNGNTTTTTATAGKADGGNTGPAGGVSKENILVQALEGLHEKDVNGGKNASTPIGSDGEPIKLPENLESLPRADHFPTQRHRWNTNEEIAAILISFDRHPEWQSKEVKIRPKSGSMLLYSRKKVRYRRDGYCWKKRKDGKTTREDHMKLKVQGTECIYGCYVHSAILPTFHRRCYWLLQNPDIVLVHYLNVPYPDDNKLAVITPNLALWADKKEWTKDELVSQLKPMFFSEDEPDLNNELEISKFNLQTAETVEAIVSQLMEKQRVARQAALVKQLECGCPDSTCADGKTCSHPMRRITAAKPMDGHSGTASSTANGGGSTSATTLNSSRPPSRADNNNQVSSTTGMNNHNHHPQPRVYSRDARAHAHAQAQSLSRCSSSSNSNSTPPLVLSLSQIQGGGGLIILNSGNASSNQSTPVSVAGFVCNTNSVGGGVTGRHKKHEEMKMDCHPAAQTHTTKKNANDAMRQSLFDYRSQAQQQSVQQQAPPPVVTTTPITQEVVMSSAPSTPSKQMDTSTHDTDVQLEQQFGETVVLLGSGHAPDRSMKQLNFFNETLDLSQEDIQRTLSANMPLCEASPTSSAEKHQEHDNHQVHSHSRHQTISLHQNQHEHHDSITGELNPMDFIDCSVVVSPTHVVDDDVFVNLDAFDMLGEFPDLVEGLDSAHTALLDVNPSDGVGEGGGVGISIRDKTLSEGHNAANSQMEGGAKITDYSPEWAYPEGGVKVLVTGPWHSTGPYTVLFDTFPVPTTLVQSGVLRCYCPAHEAGLATLQVACDGFVISNSVIFEYKLPPKEETAYAAEPKVERSNDNLLKFTLLQRLEAMDDRLQIKQEPPDGGGGDLPEDTALFTTPNFEDRLVNYCQTMSARLWQHGEELSVAWFASHKGMTLLHLAASLGYSRLVCAMLHWRAENSSLLLETEVDALSQDEEGRTPLMWACSRGHTDTAVMLYKWNHTALQMKCISGYTPLECARTNQHQELVRELEKLETRRDKVNMLLQSQLQTVSADNSNVLVSSGAVSPASSVTSLTSVASTSKSHDGVFLRPGVVTRSESQKYRMLNLDLDTFSSDGNLCGKLINSPNPLLSEGNIIHQRHLGAGSRFSKRTSVDSGIHLTGGQSSDSLSSLKSTRPISHRTRDKLSRYDRSMSLPLHSPQSACGDICGEIESLEGCGRRMDFALCEVNNSSAASTRDGAAGGSPLIDVEGVSDDDGDDMQARDGATIEGDGGAGGQSGEQDVRVLTLAEQIIAAIPERIKNESEEMMLDHSPGPSCGDILNASDTLSDVFMEPLLDQSSSSFESNEFNFEFSDHNYRYYDVGTPGSSLSPASSSLQSPCSYSLDSPSPPPTTADFCEFFQASSSIFENDFSNLTLSDREQRELYEAAKIIQKAYRSYKGRQQQEANKERAAAVLIQNYYRRYKQYAYYKQMTHAAMVIQNGYRSYCEHKRFKKSQEAAVCIQNYYRNYKEQGGGGASGGAATFSGGGGAVRGAGSRESTPSAGLKRTYSQRRQHQAARKIQQFMRQSKNKLQRERAEKERQAVQQSADARPR